MSFRLFAFGVTGAILPVACSGSTASTTVLVVAGQSNVLNWHAAAAVLPFDPVDDEIAFFHLSGAPPDRGLSPAVNASSAGGWTRLGTQTQDPFVRHEREFFGPEITLARRLARAGAAPLAVIKIGFFGTSLADDWHPEAAGGNQLYALLRQEVMTAFELLRNRRHACHFGGFFWMQGETDAAEGRRADCYADNLKLFISRLRQDLSAPDLPFVIGRIGPAPTRGYPHQDSVRDAQVRAIASTPVAAWVDTDDLPRDTDGIHLLAEGVMELGERWADCWLRLARFPSESSAADSLPARLTPD